MARRKQEEAVEVVEHKDYVDLYSEITVRVEPSVEMYQNATKQDSDIKDRMKIIEKHSQYGVLIKKGEYRYPSNILDWPVVKFMIDAKKFTVKAETDEDEGDETLKRQKELLDESKNEPMDGLAKIAEELSESKAEEQKGE